MFRALTLATAFALAPMAAMAQQSGAGEDPAISPAEQIVINDRMSDYEAQLADYEARLAAVDERLRMLEELNENPGTPPSREGFGPEGEADTDRIPPK